MKIEQKHTFLLAGIVLVLASVLSCRQSNQAIKGKEILTAMSFSNLMVAVKPWPNFISPRSFTTQDWGPLVEAARVIQASDPNSVIAAIYNYQTNHTVQNHHTDFLANDSKLFLLTRVIFKLPSRVPRDKFIFFGNWNPYPPVQDNCLNQSWPIDWNDGHPKFIAICAGWEGFDDHYGAIEEYTTFLKAYSFRDLSEFRTNTLPMEHYEPTNSTLGAEEK